jgi:hypothetical protein
LFCYFIHEQAVYETFIGRYWKKFSGGTAILFPVAPTFRFSRVLASSEEWKISLMILGNKISAKYFRPLYRLAGSRFCPALPPYLRSFLYR